MTFTKEQLREKLEHRITVAAKYPDVEEAQLDVDIFKLALSALAGMEAEPAGWFVRKKFMHSHPTFKNSPNAFPLYTAPQPLTTSERAELENYRKAQSDMNYQHLSELYHAQEKRLFKLAQRIKGPAFDKYAHSPSQAIDVLESAAFGENGDACRAAMLQGKAEPAKTGLTLREGLAAIRISGIAIDAEKILAERDALNEPTCWCRTCRPVTVTDMRFVVCPQCGNKRCPHANDCRNACTGSNEPGQEGSAYPAAPQQESE